MRAAAYMMAERKRQAPKTKDARKQPQGESEAAATDDFPTDGEEAQRRRDLMQQKDKAEGE